MLSKGEDPHPVTKVEAQSPKTRNKGDEISERSDKGGHGSISTQSVRDKSPFDSPYIPRVL